MVCTGGPKLLAVCTYIYCSKFETASLKKNSQDPEQLYVVQTNMGYIVQWGIESTTRDAETNYLVTATSVKIIGVWMFVTQRLQNCRSSEVQRQLIYIVVSLLF